MRSHPGAAKALVDEAAFIARVRAGEREAFAPLVKRYHQRLLRLCSRLLGRSDAEDAVQEAYIKAWSALHRYDATRPFASWLVEIAVNVCRDRQRGGWWRRILLEERDETLADLGVLPDQDLSRHQSVRALVEALHQLRPQDREALAALADEQPVAEAAQAMGISCNALYVRQTRARAKLVEVLRRDRPELFEE